MKQIRIQRPRAGRDTTGVRPYRPARETRMSSGSRRLPVPVIAPAEEQPGSHVPPGLPRRRADSAPAGWITR
jgi:hypothetical protein